MPLAVKIACLVFMDLYASKLIRSLVCMYKSNIFSFSSTGCSNCTNCTAGTASMDGLECHPCGNGKKIIMLQSASLIIIAQELILM